MPSRKPLQDGPLLNRTRSLLRRFNLRAKKGLGQHFLVDDETLALIVAAAGIMPSDTVLEIGPGLGVLTAELAIRAGRVIAVEKDDKLAAILKKTLGAFDNIIIVNKDILKTDPADLLREGSTLESGGLPKYKVVANLPYYITSPVLRHFLEASLKPEIMALMVQKEVAQEIVAASGKMSLLSVSVHLYARPEIVGYVPASSFYPAPKVDSAILKVTLFPEPAAGVTDTESFFSLVRAGFTASRKQLPNSLAQGLSISRDETLALLEKAGIESRRRAETLSLEEWARLWRIFAEVVK